MLSIGWVMFWKAVVLALAAAGAEKYRRFRLKQKLDGIRLRPNDAGVFVARDRLASFERFLRDLRSWGYMVSYAWWVTLAVLLIFFA